MKYWLKIKGLIDPIDNKYAFTRDEKILETYIKFKQNIPDINEYLFNTVFTKNSKNENTNIVFKENDYPYKFPKNIKHYLIWIHPNKNYSRKEVEEFLLNSISENNLQINDYILFKNNLVNKSIEQIEHYHVLLKIFNIE